MRSFRMHALGLLLFLFIPLTLTLFLQHPLGVVASFSLGIFFMATHRFVAAPFLDRYRESRCLWCGRAAAAGPMLDVASRTSVRRFAVCDDRCGTRVRRFAGFVDWHRRAIALLIFVPLLYYLPAAYVRAIVGAGPPTGLDRSLLQAPIAIAVISVALLYRWGPEPASATARVPFPIHNLFLLGIRATLIVFVGVGLVWLGQVAARAWALILPDGG